MPPSPEEAFAADISGKWRFDVETDAGSGSPSLVLKQDGQKVSGTYSGTFGEVPLNGTVDGEKVELQFEVAPQGANVIDPAPQTFQDVAQAAGKLEAYG